MRGCRRGCCAVPAGGRVQKTSAEEDRSCRQTAGCLPGVSPPGRRTRTTWSVSVCSSSDQGRRSPPSSGCRNLSHSPGTLGGTETAADPDAAVIQRPPGPEPRVPRAGRPTWLCRGGSGAEGRSASSVSEDGWFGGGGGGARRSRGGGRRTRKTVCCFGLGFGFRRTVCCSGVGFSSRRRADKHRGIEAVAGGRVVAGGFAVRPKHPNNLVGPCPLVLFVVLRVGRRRGLVGCRRGRG